MSYARALVLALLAAAATSGCGTSPPVRFFTLAAEPHPVSAAAPAFSVVVGPVTVPEVVDRPHFVLRSGAHRVDIAEQARWAAPLKSEIPRVIAGELARVLEGARTWSAAQRASGHPDYRVLIDIQRFEMSAHDGASVHALWTVRVREGGEIGGRSVVNEPGGPGYDELAGAASRALGTVGRDIAAAISAARAGKQR